MRLLGGGDEPEIVAEPLDVGPGRQHHGLDAPRQLPVAAPGHDREGALLALPVERRPVGADAHVEHPAGAEGDLGQPGQDAALADERRLLVADQGRQRRSAREVRWRVR